MIDHSENPSVFRISAPVHAAGVLAGFDSMEAVLPLVLQISALLHDGAGEFGRGFDSMDAVQKPTWMYSRRPLANTPAAKFDVRCV